MHYEIDYNELEGHEKQTKAMKDIEFYLGKAKMVRIEQVTRENPMNREAFIFGLSMFVGIHGYPAQAWADKLGLVAKSN